MAKHKRKKRSKDSDLAGWVWMIFGLAIGLSVALAIYVNDRSDATSRQPLRQQPASLKTPVEAADAVDHNATLPDVVPEPVESKPRFDFYDMLPNFEVVIPEQETDVRTDREPQAVTSPGIYVLQAGSFTEHADADRRRAELAMQGIESSIQRVSIDDKTYHRVRIGPIDDLDELNVLRNRLRQAQIEVLRIRLGDQ